MYEDYPQQYIDTAPICHAHQAFDGEYVEGTWFAEQTTVGLPGFLCDAHAADLAIGTPARLVVDPSHPDAERITGEEVALNATPEQRAAGEARVAAGSIDVELDALLRGLMGDDLG